MPSKILVIDDDVETLKFFNVMLARLGYQVFTAPNGIQALETAHKELPDLIILDVMMPGMDGYEVARSLRRHPETAIIPILMFTAKTGVEDKIAGYDSGVNLYITKPIHPVDLYANIKTLLAQKPAAPPANVKKGYVVGVLAAKGGLGVSTVALNLAIAYHQKAEGKVIAAELRPGQGSWGIELNLNTTDGLQKLLGRNVIDLTQAAVSDQLMSIFQGIHLLLASPDPHDCEQISSIAQLEAVVQQLALIGALVVLDIGTSYHPAYSILADQCDEIILVTEPFPTTIKRSQLLARELGSRGFGRSKPLSILLVNRTRSDMILSASQVENMIGQPVALGIPPANELAYRAGEQAVPLTTLQPEGVIAKQFAVLADQLKLRMART